MKQKKKKEHACSTRDFLLGVRVKVDVQAGESSSPRARNRVPYKELFMLCEADRRKRRCLS